MSLDPQRIQKSIRKLRKLVKKAPKRPAPDQVHDLQPFLAVLGRLPATFDFASMFPCTVHCILNILKKNPNREETWNSER
jgi:hypothetical protein